MKKINKYLFAIFIMILNINKILAFDGTMVLNTYQKFNCVNVEIPLIFPKIVHIIINIVEIFVPVLIVIYGMMDFAKATTAQKDDEIKKAKGNFTKRLGLGVTLFLVIALVKMIVSIFAGDAEAQAINQCFNCFINGKC